MGAMKLFIVFYINSLFTLAFGYTDDSINLLVRSQNETNIRRYCVELAKLPNGHTINITGFSWHKVYLASTAVNACDTNDLARSLPKSFSSNTLLILTEHQCKMTEHAWNVEQHFGENISLMILTNRTDTRYELTLNTSAMPVSIAVLVFWQKDFNRMMNNYQNNLTQIEISINYPLIMPKKFRPAILLMFVLVFFILLAGNAWAADEFRQKIINSSQLSPRLNRSFPSSVPSPNSLNNQSDHSQTNSNENTNGDPSTTNAKQSPTNNEPAVLSMPYCVIGVILCFAIGWLLLIYYFPQVMIYVLQAMFCIGALTSLSSCIGRLSYFLPIVRRYRIPSYNFNKPCQFQLGPLNVFTLFTMVISLTIVICWYLYRQAEWAWILQDILGAAICITVISVYRLGNMRVITLILLGFFLYDIFFVFITPYIPFFQPSTTNSTTTTTTTTTPPIMPFPKSSAGSSKEYTIRTYQKLSRNPSVMEQVALGIGTGGEVVPLLFALPMFIPELETDPCLTIRKAMLGFGDVILPGILLTFCKIFDIAINNRWPIYYTQSLVAYFLGLSLTHVALYLMNTAQPALLYLVPCILLSTILTGLCRGELSELFTGRRIKLLFVDPSRNKTTSLLTDVDHSNDENITQPANTVVGLGDTLSTESVVQDK